jgi:hypothetical protein
MPPHRPEEVGGDGACHYRDSDGLEVDAIVEARDGTWTRWRSSSAQVRSIKRAQPPQLRQEQPRVTAGLAAIRWTPSTP